MHFDRFPDDTLLNKLLFLWAEVAPLDHLFGIGDQLRIQKFESGLKLNLFNTDEVLGCFGTSVVDHHLLVLLHLVSEILLCLLGIQQFFVLLVTEVAL